MLAQQLKMHKSTITPAYFWVRRNFCLLRRRNNWKFTQIMLRQHTNECSEKMRYAGMTIENVK